MPSRRRQIRWRTWRYLNAVRLGITHYIVSCRLHSVFQHSPAERLELPFRREDAMAETTSQALWFRKLVDCRPTPTDELRLRRGAISAISLRGILLQPPQARRISTTSNLPLRGPVIHPALAAPSTCKRIPNGINDIGLPGASEASVANRPQPDNMTPPPLTSTRPIS